MAKTGPEAMSVPKIMGFIFLFCGLIYAVALIRDLIRNREALRNAPGDLKSSASLSLSSSSCVPSVFLTFCSTR